MKVDDVILLEHLICSKLNHWLTYNIVDLIRKEISKHSNKDIARASYLFNLVYPVYPKLNHWLTYNIVDLIRKEISKHSNKVPNTNDHKYNFVHHFLTVQSISQHISDK